MHAGAEVAREAGDIILLDNNFASIIAGLREGRLVSDNLKKVCLYLLPGGTWSEIWPVIFNVFAGVPLALSSFQMVVLSVLTDVVNALALVQERPELALMTRPPVDPQSTHLIDWRLLYHAYIELGTLCSLSAWYNYVQYFSSQGIPVSSLFLAWDWQTSPCCVGGSGCPGGMDDPSNCYVSEGRVYTYDELNEINWHGQSIFFISLLITNFFSMLATRTRYTSLLTHHPLWGAGKNWWLGVAIIVGSGVGVGLSEVQWVNEVFHTRPVGVGTVAPALGFGVGVLVFDEVRKWVWRHYPQSWWARTAW